MTEEEIKQKLQEKFPQLAEKILVKRARRINVEIPVAEFSAVFDYLFNQLGFKELSAITGLDEVNNFAAIYHLCQAGSVILSLKVLLPVTDPQVPSIINSFPAAEMYEREMEDLLGIKVNGIPLGNRYPLPDNWPQGEHPLRKSWKGATSGGA